MRSGIVSGWVRHCVIVVLLFSTTSARWGCRSCEAFLAAPDSLLHAVAHQRDPPWGVVLVPNKKERRRRSGVATTPTSFYGSSSRRALSSSSLVVLRAKNKKIVPSSSSSSSSADYTDDCFGLIFLSSAFVAHDTVFSVTFVVLSTEALLLTRSNRKPIAWYTKNTNTNITRERQRRAVPAVVAATTLLLSTLVLEPIITATALMGPQEDPARIVEWAVCSVSILYGFLSPVDDVDDE